MSLCIPVNTYCATWRAPREGETVWIQPEGSLIKEEVTLERCLGKGGANSAIAIKEGRVLMINLDSDPSWVRRVEQEVKACAALSKSGFYNVQAQLVSVFESQDANEPFYLTYICPSFEALASQGQYVINCIHRHSTTWKGSFLRQEDHDKRYKLATWRPIVTPLLQEIKKLVDEGLDILIGRDSLNIVVIQQESDEHPKFIPHFLGLHLLSNEPRNRGRKKAVELLASELLRKVFWAEHDHATGKWYEFPREYEKLIKEFKGEIENIVGKIEDDPIIEDDNDLAIPSKGIVTPTTSVILIGLLAVLGLSIWYYLGNRKKRGNHRHGHRQHKMPRRQIKKVA